MKHPVFDALVTLVLCVTHGLVNASKVKLRHHADEYRQSADSEFKEPEDGVPVQQGGQLLDHAEKSRQLDCDLCMVAMGESAMPELKVLLHSLKQQTRDPGARISLHIVTDKDHEKTVKGQAEEHSFEAETVVMDGPVLSRIKKQVEDMHVVSEHHSGFAGLVKSFMFELFPRVQRCILLDTDLYFNSPAVDLLNLLDKNSIMLGTWRPSEPFGDRINSGVIVQDFSKMRLPGPAGKTWLESMMGVAEAASKLQLSDYQSNGIVKPRWGDQTLLHLVLLVYNGQFEASILPGGFQSLDKAWNSEMCQKFYGHCASLLDSSEIKLGHFNCAFEEGTPWFMTAKFEEFKSCLLRKMDKTFQLSIQR
eukprot:TRINITY_DN27100_c0_g1_i1.p1 TRINITY_DN27100_c0_g1~~TRINITY_DN27100_c0_g1_i1.p1  ORF type:complete len:379 (+),score=54.27 TRINITY_DN27100_c0_g1_i1:47-1138(+)